MRVRSIDGNNDWTFGKGQNDYMRDQKAVMQNIKTRLQSFLGDCFFDNGAGVDWFNLLGAKDLLALNLAITSVILNTTEVTGILQLNTNLTATRALNISYRVQTTYSVDSDTFTLDPNGTV